MKLATYTPSVQKATSGNVRVVAPDISGPGKVMGRALTGLAGTINAAAENFDAVNAQAAANEYTKRVNELMYNQENGLMNTKFDGASGITGTFEEQERKIRQEVGSQYKFYSPKGQAVFNNMADRSAAQRYELVRKHQTQQYEAYKDVTYNNALELNTQTAADNYAVADVVDDNIKQAILATRVRLTGQGDEVIRAAERKAVSSIAQHVINRAYANGDTSSAETYIEKYGGYMDPQTLTGYAKNVYASRMETMQEVTAKSLFAQFGDNMEAAYNYINSDAFGGNGNVNSALTWYKDAEARGESLGKNQCTVGLNKALVAGGYKPINVWAPTAWDEEKAAGRTFTDRSKLRPGDIVYWDSAGDGDASHVGMYAGDGKVCQSGDSGIRTISLDTYDLIGFSRPRGKASTPEDRKKLFNAYTQEVNLRKRFDAERDKEMLDATENEFFQMYKNGVVDPEVYRMAAMQKAGDDPKLFKKLIGMANGYAHVVGGASKSSGGNGKTDPLLEDKLTGMLNNGVTATAILDFMDNPENGFSDKDKAKALDVLQKHTQGKGQFAYDMNALKDVVMADYRAKDKDFAWSNVKQKLIYDINAYRSQHGGQEPDSATVAQWGREALVEGISYSVPGKLFGTNTTKISEATAMSHGIVNVVDNPSGGKNITVGNNGRYRTITVTDAQFARIIKDNMTVEEAINAG